MDDILMLVGPRLNARCIRCVEDRAVGKDEFDILDRLVAVVGCAAAHPRCIIRADTADHRMLDGCWIRTDLALVWLQIDIGIRADDARLKRDRIAVVLDGIIVPTLCHHDEYRVGKRLTAKACTRCTEGHRNLCLVCFLNQEGNLVDIACTNDDLRGDAVKTAVNTIGIAANRIRDNTGVRDARANSMEVLLMFLRKRCDIFGTIIKVHLFVLPR